MSNPILINVLANERVASIAQTKLMKASGKGPKPLRELLADGLVTITPELAVRIINEAGFDRQRPVRPKHVAALAAQMKNREWTSGTQIHFGRLPDGMLVLVNGQHRMHAVVKAQVSVPFQVLTSNVESNEGLNRLYRRHDRLSANRSIGDALTAENIPVLHGLDKTIAAATFRAVAIINNGFRSPAAPTSDAYLMRSDEARLRVCEKYWPVAELYQSAISRAFEMLKKRLKSAGPTSVALVTLEHQEAKADTFWRGLAEQSGLQRDDPRAAYARHLLGVTKTGSMAVIPSAKAAAAAWNAFYKDEPLQIVRVTVGPVRILGTPYDNARKG